MLRLILDSGDPLRNDNLTLLPNYSRNGLSAGDSMFPSYLTIHIHLYVDMTGKALDLRVNRYGY